MKTRSCANEKLYWWVLLFPVAFNRRLCHFFRLKYIRKKLGSTGKANWIYCKSLSQQANEEIQMYALEIPRHICKLHQLFLLNFSFLLQSEVLRQSGKVSPAAPAPFLRHLFLVKHCEPSGFFNLFSSVSLD